MTNTKLLRIKQVQQLTSLSKSLSLVKGGTSVAWIESEILDWIDSRIKARNEGAK
jgi:prophage regulatory protein